MKILLSPSKKQTIKRYNLNLQTPYFIKKAENIVSYLKNMNSEELSSYLGVNIDIGSENWKRYREWSPLNSTDGGAPAIFTYVGEAFKSLSPNDFSFDDLQYANSNLLILSGLYGVLKPLDRIMTYRLEMRNQVKFWKDPITEYIKNETENSIIVDLCSSEYSKAINFNNIKSTIITPDFKSLINGKLKSISVFSKQMRGLLAKEIILNRVKTEEELQKIDLEGYTLENITNKNYLYVRK